MINQSEVFKRDNFFSKNKSNSSLGNIYPCQLPMIKLSCFGCCGRCYKSKEAILEDLKKNTKEFDKIRLKSSLRLLQFRDRLSDDPWKTSDSGLCSNVVEFSNGVIACPLHPKINKIVPKNIFNLVNNKFDLRAGHCDIHYECELFKVWKNLSEKQRQIFIDWIDKQNFDNYSYSMGNVEGINLYNFLDLINKK